MIQIERQVQVSYRHRVLFTKGVFEASNPVLRDLLLEGFKSDPVKVLVIADDGLVRAYPELSGQIHRYFDQYPDIDLVCPAIIAEGGERVKNSYFHVSEIQSPIDRYHIDRHSYVCLLYTSPSPRDGLLSRMPSSA